MTEDIELQEEKDNAQAKVDWLAREKEDAQEVYQLAWENKEELVFHRKEVQYNFLHLARLLKLNRDKSYYKLLGYDSFEEFLADPELAFRKSTAYMLIGHFELYVEKLHRQNEELADVGSRRLTIIRPVVELDPDTWMANAKAMSKSDLSNEVRQAQGLPEVIPPRQEQPKSVAPCRFYTPESYIKYVKSEPCCVCEKSPVDPAHFPRTKGAGADEWKVLPLCRVCHSQQHDGGKDWLWGNRVKLFDYFYNLIIPRED